MSFITTREAVPAGLPLLPESLPPGLRRNVAFRCFLGARVGAGLVFQMVGVVVGWQVYLLTGSTFELGLVGLAQFLPMLLLTLPAGAAADKFARLTISVMGQLGLAVATGALALGSWFAPRYGWQHGWVEAIFCLVALVGISRTFGNPATAALLPALVHADDLPQAISLGTSANQVATVVGPALGGLLLICGAPVAYAAACLCALGAGALMLAAGQRMIARPAERRRNDRPLGGRLQEVLSGFAFIRTEKRIMGAVLLDMVAVLLGGSTALLPVFAHDILHVGPVGLGMLRAAPAVGALVTALLLAKFPLRKKAGEKMFYAVMVFGLATLGFGISTSMVVSLAMLLVLGAADVVSVVMRTTLVQLLTPDTMRGRVSAVNFLFVGTSNQLGEFESGMTASWFGTVPAVLIGGAGTLAVVALWMKLFPALAEVDDLRKLRPRNK